MPLFLGKGLELATGAIPTSPGGFRLPPPMVLPTSNITVLLTTTAATTTYRHLVGGKNMYGFPLSIPGTIPVITGGIQLPQ